MTAPNDWNQFLHEVEAKRAELGFEPGEDCLYRGHPDTNYSLMPSLYRTGAEALDKGQYWQLESDLFFEFQARAHQLHGRGISDWDYLFHMRHHGVSTRLLDWTEVLGVALYFAVLGYDATQARQPCVWLLNPWSLNEANWTVRDLIAPKYLGWYEDEDYDYGEILVMDKGVLWDLPVAIYPQQTNPRLAAQKGLFTIHGNEIGPLESLCGEHVRKVELPMAAISDATHYLRILGVDTYVFFPDLDGLARALDEKYSLLGRAEERVTGRSQRAGEERREMRVWRAKARRRPRA
jgi:FRG domain